MKKITAKEKADALRRLASKGNFSKKYKDFFKKTIDALERLEENIRKLGKQ